MIHTRLLAIPVAIALASCGSYTTTQKTVNAVDSACQMPASPPAVSEGQSAFDTYSWQMFVALNWPASSTQRGEPDCAKTPSDAGPRVWQTYKSSDEVFLDNAADPGSWNAGYGATPIRTIKQIAKANDSTAIDSNQEAVGGWLIDQQGNPTYFQMWVNENWYNYTRENQLYNRNNFASQSSISLPWNSAEIKSAWRILTPSDNAAEYITQESEVAKFDDNGNPNGETETVTLGLTGLHIIYKPEGYPEWIWATFEHYANVPDAKYNPDTYQVSPDPQPGVTYSYFNADHIPGNQSPCSQSNHNDCQSFSMPTPLTRVTPIRSDAKNANNQFHQNSNVQGSALANYLLITTQWPTKPNNPSALWGDPTPTISANTTMESYIQPSSSCLNCHGMAQLPGTQTKADFSFLFHEAQSN